MNPTEKLLKVRDHFSHSSIAAFDCPRKGYRSTVEREDEGQSIPLVLGSAFHNLMETVFMLEVYDRDKWKLVWPKFFYDYLGTVQKWQKGPPEKQYIEKAFNTGMDMIDNMFDKLSRFLVAPYKDTHDGKERVWVEQQFHIEVLGVPLTGFLDLVIPNPEGGVDVVDWKTGGTLPEVEKQTEISSYTDQMQLYALAGTEMGLEVKSMNLVYPKLGRVISYVPSENDKIRQEWRVERLISNFADIDPDNVGREDFILRPHKKTCLWCGYKDDCSAYAEFQTDQKKEANQKQKNFRSLLKKIK